MYSSARQNQRIGSYWKRIVILSKGENHESGFDQRKQHSYSRGSRKDREGTRRSRSQCKRNTCEDVGASTTIQVPRWWLHEYQRGAEIGTVSQSLALGLETTDWASIMRSLHSLDMHSSPLEWPLSRLPISATRWIQFGNEQVMCFLWPKNHRGKLMGD